MNSADNEMKRGWLGNGLSTRAFNVLIDCGVLEIEDFKNVTHMMLKKAKNCGTKTYNEIIIFATNNGVKLNQTVIGNGICARCQSQGIAQ